MAFEAYSVAIRLTLINGVSQGLGLISGHLRTTGHDVDALHSKLKEIKMLGLAGAAVGGAGYLGLGLIGKTLKPASEYAHQLALMNTAGMKHLEIVKATNAAWAANRDVPTTSTAENLAAIRELRMVFRSSEHAIEFMPTVQKIQSILSTVRHGEGKAKSEAYELAKALELKGAVKTPTEFVGQADLITKAIVASGGKVGATDFLQAFKYGRAATSGWNDDFAYKILPTLIQELKGGGGGGASGGPGSPLMSAYSAIVGGTITQRALKLWQQIGLVDPSKAVWTKDGHLKGVAPGGIRGSDQFQANPYDWVQQVLMPALQSHGYKSDPQIKQALQYLFPNRTAGFVMSQFATQPWKFEGDKKIIEEAHGLDSYNQLLKTDPMMAQAALAKQWENIKAILGFQVMPQLIAVYRKAADVATSLSLTIKEHPKLFKTLMWAFIGLSGAMAFSGTVMMLTAGFHALRIGLTVLRGAAVLAAGGQGAVGIPTLISLLGKTGLVAAAGAAGFAIGTLINKLLGIDKGELGSWLYDKLHDSQGRNVLSPFRLMDNMNPQNRDAFLRGLGGGPPVTSNTVSRHGAKTVQVHSQINLDGRQVATVVSKHQANAADGPQKGISSFDMLMAPTPVGF